ncbi:hypothetical protein CCH79_00014539 [Gambusia affinis]|uniref:Chemokine interleukin-8-like domain-containing protein n=1 Tax=Gambusia affinis TaxID=33528 RepID=A0A315USQ5_GAMAF|nr:hypothetical protein CCH79_00014539 [Gambusia affinis]
MKAANILLLCMLGAALLSTVLCHSGNMPADCCFSFVKQRMDKNLMSSYHKTDHRCSLSGIILTTKRGRSICVDPEQPWVNTIIDFLNKKSQILESPPTPDSPARRSLVDAKGARIAVARNYESDRHTFASGIFRRTNWNKLDNVQRSYGEKCLWRSAGLTMPLCQLCSKNCKSCTVCGKKPCKGTGQALPLLLVMMQRFPTAKPLRCSLQSLTGCESFILTHAGIRQHRLNPADRTVLKKHHGEHRRLGKDSS